MTEHISFPSQNPFYCSGILGMILIALFTINAGFSGTRLGLCWVMLEERYTEFKGEVRDPYPAIAEKAIGRVSNGSTINDF